MDTQTQSQRHPGDIRVRAFVDFWNFQLAMNRWRPRFPLDWKRLGPWLAERAGESFLSSGQQGRIRFEGLHVYLSHNPAAPRDDGLRRWATVLARFPGVSVVLKQRRRKHAPECPGCLRAVDQCPDPACGASMCGTAEKGIDTAIVTDMIRLAWEDTWDVAVLVSADGDFVPAVELLGAKGRKIVHGGFPPIGTHLARRCFASFDIAQGVQALERVPSANAAKSPASSGIATADAFSFAANGSSPPL